MTLAVSIDDFSIEDLGLAQRVLVTTDGTVTEALAAIFLEPIELVKIAIAITHSDHPLPHLELKSGSSLMRRQVVLRGSRTSTPYAYAQVVIAADRLAPDLRRELLDGRTPLGELWIRHRVEIFKERPRIRRRPAGEFARYLDLGETETLIERTYRAFAGRHPVFLVTEYFPTAYRQPLPEV